MSRFPRGGTLVDKDANLWIPYDLNNCSTLPEGLESIAEHRRIFHAEREEFRFSAKRGAAVYILCGMGIMLGDSIIGLSALESLAQARPDLQIHLCRPRRGPGYVDELYQAKRDLFAGIHYLPMKLAEIPDEAVIIDLADSLYRPSFAQLPMLDFWARSIGFEPQRIPAALRANQWLKCLPISCTPSKILNGRRYVLFCPTASTPLRSIPPTQKSEWVERIFAHYRLPVVGFGAVEHSKYLDVSSYSPNTLEYFSWIAAAAALIATDSSAVHIAAGFDIPTMALFVSMHPELRVRDYTRVNSVLQTSFILGDRHESEDPEILKIASGLYGSILARRTLPWPTAIESVEVPEKKQVSFAERTLCHN